MIGKGISNNQAHLGGSIYMFSCPGTKLIVGMTKLIGGRKIMTEYYLERGFTSFQNKFYIYFWSWG